MDLAAIDTKDAVEIPSGWSERRLQDVAQLINGRGFKPFEWDTAGLPIIRIQNLNGSSDFNYYSGRYDPKIEVDAGQLLFAWSGSRGTSFGPHIWNGPKGVLNYHTWKVRVNENEIVPSFFFHVLRHLTRIIEDQAHGASALVHVQKWEMEKFPFQCPDETEEQEAIAAALTDADAIIEVLERLIAKKRLIKHGAIQDLLTAKRRTKGRGVEFDEQGQPTGWRHFELSELASFITGPFGSTFHKSDYVRGGVPLINPSHIVSGSIIPDEGISISTEMARRLNGFALRESDVVIGRRGEMGRCAVVTAMSAGFLCGTGSMIVRPKDTTMADLLQAILSSPAVVAEIEENSVGTTMINLNQATLASLRVLLPFDPDERVDLASMLFDMDAEIQAVETRLEKARAVKEGMMQNLLTGRIRLV